MKSDIIPDHAKIGCFAEGEGRNAVFLAKQGHDVTAYDQSVMGLEKAQLLAKRNNVTIQPVEKDLTKERVSENQYDVAIMVFGHVHKTDQQFFINNIIGSVNPG